MSSSPNKSKNLNNIMSNKSKIRNILLTGPPGIGKTILILKTCDILKEKNIPVFGFYTQELRNNSNSRIGFDIVTLDGNKGRLARTSNSVGANEHSRYKVGNYLVFINEFETLALPVLNKRVENAVFIVDEIGKMELFSSAFERSVVNLFNVGNIKILATIPIAKGKPLPLVEKLRNDPMNSIMTVTRENRNDLMEEILKQLDLN